VVLDGFDDDDRVVDDQADGQDQPKSDSVLTENPRSGNTMNVPISDTGTAIMGISVARQFCRNEVDDEQDQDERLDERAARSP
jgi:hypothetical protein